MEWMYRSLVLLLLVLQLVWFFFPWGLGYDSESVSAMYWIGHDSIVSARVATILSYVFGFVYVAACVGLIYFIRLARFAYLVALVLGGAVVLLCGISVQSAYEASLGYFLTLGDGFVLALSYFTSINRNFAKLGDA